MKCGDCGSTKCKASRGRGDICEECMILRDKVILLPLDQNEFLELQRTMRRRNGTAKAVMERLLRHSRENDPLKCNHVCPQHSAIERCEVCNGELSQCGSPGVDGELGLECRVCNLMDTISEYRNIVSEAGKIIERIGTPGGDSFDHAKATQVWLEKNRILINLK